MLNEAIYALFENVAAPADIDKIMQLGVYLRRRNAR
jgi:3-hydroxyacyl-CoA dehydrogenase